MEWLGYALLAAALLMVVNFGDKYIVESQVTDARVLLILLPLSNLVLGLIVWVLSGLLVLPPADALPLIWSGLSITGGIYFYFRAVSRTEASRIILMLQIEPLFVLLLSMIFLQERLTPVQLGGFALILAAVLAASFRRQPADTATAGTNVLLLMLAATIIWSGGIVAAGSVLDRIVVDIPSLFASIAYTNLGYAAGGVLIYVLVAPVRRAFHLYLPRLTLKSVLAISAVELTFVIRQMVSFTALSLGPVALVTIVGSLNVFFGVFAGWLLTLWKPHIFKEDTSRRALGMKFGLAGVAFAGLLLLG